MNRIENSVFFFSLAIHRKKEEEKERNQNRERNKEIRTADLAQRVSFHVNCRYTRIFLKALQEYFIQKPQSVYCEAEKQNHFPYTVRGRKERLENSNNIPSILRTDKMPSEMVSSDEN